MVEQTAVDYVRKAAKKGFSFDDTARLLKKYGYKQRDIDEALWVVSREVIKKEEKKKEVKPKAEKKTELEMPPHPELDISSMPGMPRHIKPKHKPIHEVEKKTEEKIVQKFHPEKEKHWLKIVLEIIGGIILFAVVGILMYLFLWPAVLGVK